MKTAVTTLTVRASGLKFIINHMTKDIIKENRLFLCLILGYYAQRHGHDELSTSYPSEHLFDALENYKQETLPSDTAYF